MSDALLIAAHGSRDEAGVDEFWALADAWSKLRPDRPLAAGFLEFERPTIGEAVDDLVAQGANRIVVAPAMLTTAGHVKNDLPSELDEARSRHPGLNLVMAGAARRPSGPAGAVRRPVSWKPSKEGGRSIPRGRSCWSSWRGTSDPDANANIARGFPRFLWESYGVAWATVAYSGLARPGVDEALDVGRRMGFERIVVQPYLLFDGVLVRRIRETPANGRLTRASRS